MTDGMNSRLAPPLRADLETAGVTLTNVDGPGVEVTNGDAPGVKLRSRETLP